MNAFHSAGKRVLVAAFGDSDTPTTSGTDAFDECTEIAQWALDHKLDGVNIDYLDAAALEADDGAGE